MEAPVVNEYTLSFNTIVQLIKQKENIEKIADLVFDNPSTLEELVTTLESEKSSLKFTYEKLLRFISEKDPELLYPHFAFFVKLLDSENNFLIWGAIITIANLTSVDGENKFDKVFKKYYLPVTGPAMIAAANIIGNSWKIALAKPHLAAKITNEILKVQNGKYINKGKISAECKNVVCGKAIDSFSLFFERIENKKAVLDFVKKQLRNSRASVRKKAENFLRRFG
jgi:hypothetical protein